MKMTYLFQETLRFNAMRNEASEEKGCIFYYAKAAVKLEVALMK